MSVKRLQTEAFLQAITELPDARNNAIGLIMNMSDEEFSKLIDEMSDMTKLLRAMKDSNEDACTLVLLKFFEYLT